MTLAELYNVALTGIGATPIVNPEENTQESRLAKLHWESGVRDAFLRRHPWRFALKWAASLTAAPGVETGGTGTAYQLPSDFLRLWYCSVDPYYIMGEYLVAPDAPTIQYTAQITDVTKWDPLALSAAAAKLAAEIAIPLTGQGQLIQYFEQKYLATIQEAMTAGAMETTYNLDSFNDVWKQARQQ